MKTKRKRFRKRRTKKNEISYHRLERLYRKLFDQFGWMILAHEYDMNEEVSFYVSAVERILEAIQTSKKDVDGLELMESNVKILLTHVQKDFKK
jgi:hypothetical protein